MVAVFSGQRRVFFIMLAFAFLAQAALFLAGRVETAMVLLNDDFKIVVVSDNAPAGDAAAFKTALAALPGVTKARAVDNSLKQSLSADFLPGFYELSVDNTVLLNPETWVQNNIESLGGDVSVYFKEEQAKLAVYINAVMRMAGILFACGALALISFGFFVEAFYTKPVPLKARTGGALAAVFAFALAWGIAYILAAPLNKIEPAYEYVMADWRQAALLAACFLAGWTLAKWKRF